MSAELRRAHARYGTLKDAARRKASLDLRERFGLNLRIARWDRGAEIAWRRWTGRLVEWDRPQIFRRYGEPKSFDMAMWSVDDRLVGLALATMTPEAVTVPREAGLGDSGGERKLCSGRGRR